MPLYTMTLKKVHEMEKGNVGLDSYPLFDPAYREALNQKILDHYWNQEIGQENISMWRFAMRRKMNEIMPLYNQQYKLSLLEIDPLSTVNIKTMVHSVMNNVANNTSENILNGTSTGTMTGTSGGTSHDETETTASGGTTSNSTSESKARAIGSDFPQVVLMDNGDYATTGQDTISSTEASGTGTEESTSTVTADGTTTGTNEQTTGATEEQTVTGTEAQTSDQDGTTDSETTGYQGHSAELISRAREVLVNVDMMVINDLRDLFMLITSNNDSFTGRHRRYYGLY